MTSISVNELPFLQKVITYLQYFMLFILSYSREFFGKFIPAVGANAGQPIHSKPGYPPLIKVMEWGCFFEKWLYGRINDLFGRPISGIPGAYIDVILRTGTKKSLSERLKLTTETRRCLNLGSYNYLGFAENTGPCVDSVEQSIRDFGTAITTPRLECGTTSVHVELERLMSEFLGKEDCVTFGMGYATNSTNIPVLAGRGDLIISDMLNHASIIVGCRSSGATIKVFKHNDPVHLERVIRNAIVEGQPRTYRPWNRIIIVVEGIYSMEGEIVKLPEIIAVKKKYKCYLYVDEAHSIGALGPSGRGVCEYWGVATSEVDILMGTFTKSFASVGGYICSDRKVISYLRRHSYSSMCEVSMPVPLAQQIITSLSIIMGRDGSDDGKRRLKQLHENATYFRERLSQDGFLVIGNKDSPVIPMMVLQPSKMPAFSRLCLEGNIAVVMASYPATELELARARFCVSAAHTKEDLVKACDMIKEIGEICMLRYSKNDNAIVKKSSS